MVDEGDECGASCQDKQLRERMLLMFRSQYVADCKKGMQQVTCNNLSILMLLWSNLYWSVLFLSICKMQDNFVLHYEMVEKRPALPQQYPL